MYTHCIPNIEPLLRSGIDFFTPFARSRSTGRISRKPWGEASASVRRMVSEPAVTPSDHCCRNLFG